MNKLNHGAHTCACGSVQAESTEKTFIETLWSQ